MRPDLTPPVIMVANGERRLCANRTCWAAQSRIEAKVADAVAALGRVVRRGHAYDAVKRHGFIDSHHYGIEVFRSIPRQAPLMVVAAVRQHSPHLLPGLLAHQGPILTVVHWGEGSALSLLNLNACLRKAGVAFDCLWSASFEDDFFLRGLARWLNGQRVEHDLSHVRLYSALCVSGELRRLGAGLATQLHTEQASMGILVGGCEEMYNAVVPDEMLHAMGVIRDRLNESELCAAMLATPDAQAWPVYQWLLSKGMTYRTGADPERDLTTEQIIQQCKLYIAALRLADELGCEAVGMQCQPEFDDLTARLLNNVDRPPVANVHGHVIYEGRALPHFNAADECAGLDALVTNRVWRALGFPPETVSREVRHGELHGQEGSETYVWTLDTPGSVPPAHLVGGISKPGEIVWSRVSVLPDGLDVDIGRGRSVELPDPQTDRHLGITAPQRPMMHAVLPGITRDQFMARHASNHIQVAYAPDAAGANRAMAAKATTFHELGANVHFCGELPERVQ
ncbi:MAG: fucose isomerase [Proteobacteria bacterium]|nr:fucose isomerase [Pseudomonadota bacterium]